MVYPALMSFGLTAMKPCLPFLRSVDSSSRVSSCLPGWRLAFLNSCNRARRGYTTWAHPIISCLFPCFLCLICGPVLLIAIFGLGWGWFVGWPLENSVVLSWPSVFIVNVSPPSECIVTTFPSADTSMVCARFLSFPRKNAELKEKFGMKLFR